MGNIYEPPADGVISSDPNLVGVWKYQIWTRGYIVSLCLLGLLALVSIPFSFGLSILYVPFLMLMWSINQRARKKSVVLVYKDRLEINNSFIRNNQVRFEASKIEAVFVSQSLLGKSLYGSVRVTGSGGTKAFIMPIIDPESLGEAIRSISSAPNAKPAAAAVAPALVATQVSSASETQQDTVTQLKQLKELLDLGILTPEEFESKKAALIDKI